METHLAIMSTPSVQMNPQALATYKGIFKNTLDCWRNSKRSKWLWNKQVQKFSKTQRLCRCTACNRASSSDVIADMTEQYAQTVEPQDEGTDPLVAIRQQELQLKSS